MLTAQCQCLAQGHFDMLTAGPGIKPGPLRLLNDHLQQQIQDSASVHPKTEILVVYFTSKHFHSVVYTSETHRRAFKG